MSSQPSLPCHFAAEEADEQHLFRKRRGASSPVACSLLQISARTMARNAFISYGQLSESVVVVHTSRSGRTRLISARKANSRERRAYYEHLSKVTKGD